MTVRPLTLSARPAALHWAALIGGTLAFVALFRLGGLPAALLLGAIAGAILVASFEGRVHIPPRSFILAQGVIGCLIAKAIGAASMGTMLKQWPIFLIGIGTVMAFAAVLGVLLARWKVLPGTTAIWGSSPGAATAMVLMAEAFGADIRLVAVMQYLRVAFVGLIASIVAREWAAPGAVGARADGVVSRPHPRAFAGDAGDRGRRGRHWGEVQDPCRPFARDASDRHRA